jgi:hypothetical protein
VLLSACVNSDPAPPSNPVAQPKNVVAKVGSASSVGLIWSKVDSAIQYELERKVGSGDFASLTSIAHEIGGATVVSFTDSGLTAASRYTYRVRVSNAQGKSDWSTSAEVQTLAAASTKYNINGNWLGSSNPNMYLYTDTGVNFTAATVTLNGTPLTVGASSGSYYAPSLPGASPAGTVLNLNITVPEGVITAQASIPQAPVITAPTTSTNATVNTALTVTWTYPGGNPDRFFLQLNGNGVYYVLNEIPGTDRSAIIPADQIKLPTSGNVVVLYLKAVNDGKSSFTGPFMDTSAMGVATEAQVNFKTVP